MTWIYGGDCLETVREEEGGGGGERPGDWNVRGLTWWDSEAILRAKAKQSGGNFRQCRSAGVRWPARGSARRGSGRGEREADVRASFSGYTQPRRPRLLSSSNSNSHSKMREVG